MHVRVNNNNVIKYENRDSLLNIPPLPVLLSVEGTGRVRERSEKYSMVTRVQGCLLKYLGPDCVSG